MNHEIILLEDRMEYLVHLSSRHSGFKKEAIERELEKVRQLFKIKQRALASKRFPHQELSFGYFRCEDSPINVCIYIISTMPQKISLLEGNIKCEVCGLAKNALIPVAGVQ